MLECVQCVLDISISCGLPGVSCHSKCAENRNNDALEVILYRVQAGWIFSEVTLEVVETITGDL